MSFNTICQKLIDAWVATRPEVVSVPEDIYHSVVSILPTRARLTVFYTSDPSPKEWILSTVKHSRITARILNLDTIFAGGKLGELRDQTYVEEAVLPQYLRAMERKQPTLDSVVTKILGVRVTYDRIILPQKTPGRPEWLVVCTYGKFMAKVPATQLDLDPTDEAIVLALIDGKTSKEIALEVGLSHRTVEHRLDRMKKQIGARSLPHLSALFVCAGFDRTIRFKDQP